MKRKHLFHSFVFLMTGLVTLAFGHVAQADNTTTAESSTSETMQKIETQKRRIRNCQRLCFCSI